MELQEDISSSLQNRSLILGLDNNQGGFFQTDANNWISAGTAPSTSVVENWIWYDTTNNRIKIHNGTDSMWQDTDSGGMPLFLNFIYINVLSYKINSTIYKKLKVESVFNAIGLMPGIIWVDKDVKYLIPNGKNPDGTFNNIEQKTTKLSLLTNVSSQRLIMCGQNGIQTIDVSNYFIANEAPSINLQTGYRWFNPQENKMYSSETNRWTQVFEIPVCKNGPLSSQGAIFQQYYRWKIYEPVQLATTEQIVITKYQNGKSGYRIWSDGWCEQWGYQETNPKTGDITLLKSYRDMNYNITQAQGNSSAAHSAYITGIYPTANDTMHYAAYDTNVARNFWWHTYGFLANNEY